MVTSLWSGSGTYITTTPAVGASDEDAGVAVLEASSERVVD
jgi:hypothetical protein